MNKKVTAHLSVLFANIIYGANYSIAKEVMPSLIKPFGFIVIRVCTAAILFLLTYLLLFREKIERRDWPRLFACAVFGVAVNQLLFFKGLSLTSPINSGLMMVTNPIFVLVLSFILLSEPITTRRVIGIACGISGASLLIIFGGHITSGVSNPLGDLYILINSLSYALFLVIVLPLMKKYHPVTIMQAVFLMGSVMVLPFGWGEFTEIQWHTFQTGDWMATVFVVVGTTFLAYLFNTLALRELSAGVVSVYIYLQPLLAAGFAILLGKDQPNVLHLIAAALIFSGVWLTTKSARVKASQ
ncbi:MAG: DMT family transporter [Bacteroidetes bacterium]|nr:DMT family transporter [Bacteroidota bacterium]